MIFHFFTAACLASGLRCYGPLLRRGHAWGSTLTVGPPVQEECEELGKPSGGYKRVTAEGTRPIWRGQGKQAVRAGKRGQPPSSSAPAGQLPTPWSRAPPGWGKRCGRGKSCGLERSAGTYTKLLSQEGSAAGYRHPSQCLRLRYEKLFHVS